MARNCQPVKVVTREEIQITAAIARKYDEENTNRMLWFKFRGPVWPLSFAISCASPMATCPLRQIRITSQEQIKRNRAMPSSNLSVPNVLTMVLEKRPAEIHPAIAPPP